MVAKKNSKKVVNEVVENVVAEVAPAEVAEVENVVVNEVAENESEVQAMENVNEVVNEVVENVAEVAEVENEVAPTEVENVQADQVDNTNDGEKKERKERAKINTDAFPIAEIVRDRLTCLLPEIVAGMGGVENAEELGKAKLFSIGHDIIIDLIDKLQVKFLDYAPRCYANSNHWLLWENTRNASRKVKADLEKDLFKLYSVIDEKVYSLLENDDYYIIHNARYTIENNIDAYVMQFEHNLGAQLKALDAAGITKIYVPEEYTTRKFNNALQSYGFVDTDELSIEERTYPGINKKFKAISDLVVYEKQ